MKLVYVITGLNAGGAESFLASLSRHLTPDHSIEVISLSSPGQLAPQLEALGIPVTALGMRSGHFSLSGFGCLVKLLRRSKPDVVHTWMYHANLVGGLASRLARVPRLVWSIHHSNLSRDVNKFSTLLVVRMGALLSHFVPDQIIYVAKIARQAHERRGYARAKAVVIPNGFDIVKFHADAALRADVRNEFGLDDATPLVGVVARFDIQKGHATFVKVAAHLRRLMPSVRFLLAGRDVDSKNPMLMRWLDAERLQDAVLLLGHRTDVNRLMAGLDVLLLPSVGEALPNVVGEAMATGIPCVATDVGDTAMLIDDTGLVSPPGDAVRLSELLAQVLAMPRAERQALGARARKRIQEHFQLNVVAKRYINSYSGILDAGT